MHCRVILRSSYLIGVISSWSQRAKLAVVLRVLTSWQSNEARGERQQDEKGGQKGLLHFQI